MEQALTLGAYAGTLVLPLVRAHADPATVRVIDGIVRELWAGLPLVYDRSYFDSSMSIEAVERTMTPGYGVDKGRSPTVPEDLVSEVLDMVRTVWQFAHLGNSRELAQVVRFRSGELAAGMDSVYAVTHGPALQSRPGPFEAIVKECLELVRNQRGQDIPRALGDQDLYDHAITTGTHLLECIQQGTPIRMLTRPQMDLLALQLTTLLTLSGFRYVSDDGVHYPGVRVELVDDIHLAERHIAVYWHPGNAGSEHCDTGAQRGEYSAETLHRSRVVGSAMAHAMEEILEAAGFDVRIDPEVGDSYALVAGLREPELFASFIEDLEPAPGQ